MVYYEDLSNPVYQEGVKHTNVIMCGWLSYPYPYIKGKSPINYQFFLRAAKRSRCAMMMGHHICEFCSWRDAGYGNGEIWLKVGNKLWTLPRMVWHYIKEHEYLIPQELVEIINKRSYELIEEEYKPGNIIDLQIEYVPYIEAVAKWKADRFKDLQEFDFKVKDVWHQSSCSLIDDHYVINLGERWRYPIAMSLYQKRHLIPDEITMTKMCQEG